MKRVALAVAGLLVLSGCSHVSDDVNAPKSIDISYVRLSDGRLLECIATFPNGDAAYSCNWGNPIEGAR